MSEGALMHYVFGLLCVCALGVIPLFGCSETSATGGGAGSSGCGGSAGWPEPPTACEGTVCSCDRQGIQAAIREGGGPYTFDCGGPWTLVTVVTQLQFEIDKDVILDAEGYMTVEGSAQGWVFAVAEGVAAELHGFTVRASSEGEAVAILNKGMLTLTDSTLGGNEMGNGIHNLGTLTMKNGTVSTAGLFSQYGILNEGTMTLLDSVVSTAGLFSQYGILNEGTMTLLDSVVSGHWVGVDNRGTATLSRSTVSLNSIGVWNHFGTITMTNSTVSENTTGLSDEFSHFGGSGILNAGLVTEGGGTVTLISSTVSGNERDCPIANRGDITLTNSTVSNDFGICNHEGGILTVSHSTLAGETAEFGGAIDAATGSTTTLMNSVVAGDCLGEGVVTSGGYNIQSPNDTCGFDTEKGDLVTVGEEALNLSELHDWGGPTETHALKWPSVAIDLIPTDRCVGSDGEALLTDQRGEERPYGVGCDVGAFEWQPGDPIQEP